MREVLPDLPAPQTLKALCQILERGARMYAGNLLAPLAEAGPVLGAFCGRPYFNLTQFRHVCRSVGIAPAAILQGLGHQGELDTEDSVARFPPPSRLLRLLPDFLRLAWYQISIRNLIRRQFRGTNRKLKRFRDYNPAQLGDRAIWAVLRDWQAEAPKDMRLVFALGGQFVYQAVLEKLCTRLGVPPERIANSITIVGSKSVSAQQAFDLLSLAQTARREQRARDFFQHADPDFNQLRDLLAGTTFLTQFDRFLQVYGHRGTFETDWALPRYREVPLPLLQVIRAHVRAETCPLPDEIHGRQQREAAQVWATLSARMYAWQRPWLKPILRLLARKAQAVYQLRERARFEMVRVIGEVRRWHLVLAERFQKRDWLAQRDDYFFLELEEIEAALGDASRSADLASIVDRRKAERARWQQLEMPLALRESELSRLVGAARPVTSESRDVRRKGLCVSAGCVTGTVVVLQHPNEAAFIKPGAILVAPATDPSWTPLFTLAGGVIVEIGGLLSHAAVIAREFGLPALANVPDATRWLKNGDEVRLDATRGVVEILD
ncbi:MAG: hypothetical protein HY040_11970 [Planctomycetes bacterium]|nr:hypothetical protein [Planctomycetota bacterium]